MSVPGSSAELQRKEALRRYEELELLYRTAPVGLAMIDRELRHIRINDRLAAFNGLSAAAHIGRTIHEMAPVIAPELEKHFRRIFTTGEPVLNVEIHRRAAPGQAEDLYSLGQYYPVKGADGQVEAISVVVVDITNRKRTEQTLQHEHDFSDAVINSLPGVFYLYDEKRKFLRWNSNFERVTGYTAAEIATMSPLDFFAGEEKRLLDARIKDVFQQGVASVEAGFVSKDGRATPYYFTGVRARIDGQTCLVGVGIDITEHRGTEEELRAKQAQLLEALRITKLAYWEYDVLKDQFHFNDQFYHILHTTAAREGGYTMSSADYARRFVHADDMALVGVEIQKALATPDPNYSGEIDHRINYADGGVGHMAVHIRVEKDAQGRTVRTHGANMDITARKIAEEELRWRTALFEAQLDSTIDGILVVDTAGKKIIQNRRLAEIWKIPPEIADSKDDSQQVLFVTGRAKNQQQFAAKVAHLYSHPSEISQDEIELVDGTVLDRYSAPIWDKQGKLYGRIWTFRDITERKHLEEQLRQSQKMEAIGQLSGGVAHDFNNLLTVINGHIGLLQMKGHVSPELSNSIQQIAQAANRAGNLTRQLLTFSRQEVMRLADHNLNGLVANLLKMLRRLLGEHIELEVDYAPGPVPIRADEGMVEQVLLNLVVNARDAMPKGGMLRIATATVDITETEARAHPESHPGAFVCLLVSDTGHGIPAAIMPRIFEPFFTTKEVGKGTGLGLATVYGIMQQHDGWITVESQPGCGTSFRAYFPRLASAVAENAAAESMGIRGGHETVFLVEDEETVRSLGVAALSGLGYRVLCAASGAEALQLWQMHRHEVDLLITDLVMPGGVNGRELAERLLAELPTLPVVYMSGYSHEVAGKNFPLEEGRNYLPKPFDVAKLAAIVRANLDRDGNRSP